MLNYKHRSESAMWHDCSCISMWAKSIFFMFAHYKNLSYLKFIRFYHFLTEPLWVLAKTVLFKNKKKMPTYTFILRKHWNNSQITHLKICNFFYRNIKLFLTITFEIGCIWYGSDWGTATAAYIALLMQPCTDKTFCFQKGIRVFCKSALSCSLPELTRVTYSFEQN